MGCLFASLSLGVSFAQSLPPSAGQLNAQAESSVRSYAASVGNLGLVNGTDNGTVNVVQGETPDGTHGASATDGNGNAVILVPQGTDGEMMGIIATHEWAHLGLGHIGMTKPWSTMTDDERKTFWGEECEAHCLAASALVIVATQPQIPYAPQDPSCAAKDLVLQTGIQACWYGENGDDAVMGPLPLPQNCPGFGALAELPCQ